MAEPLSALGVLHGVGTAVSAAFTVYNTLIQVGQAIQQVDRTLQQLQREVQGLQETLERMGQDFSGPIGQQLLQTNTGSLGNHWRAVLKIIERANRTLSEMESCLRRVPYGGGGGITQPLRAAWLSFKEMDIGYYRNEIDILSRNMQFEIMMVLVCRDLQGMSQPGQQGFEVDLVTAEDRWQRLRTDAANLQSSSTSMRSQSTNPYRRPTRNSSATTLVPDGASELPGNNEYLRHRQFETAKEIQDYLSTASDLLSDASTVCAEPYYPYQGSFGDDGVQTPQKQAQVMAYVQDLPNPDRDTTGLPEARDKPTNLCLVLLLFLPRMIAGGFLCMLQILFYCFALVYIILWASVLPCLGFRNVSGQWKNITRDLGRMNNWFIRSWHWTTGCS